MNALIPGKYLEDVIELKIKFQREKKSQLFSYKQVFNSVSSFYYTFPLL